MMLHLGPGHNPGPADAQDAGPVRRAVHDKKLS